MEGRYDHHYSNGEEQDFLLLLNLIEQGEVGLALLKAILREGTEE